MKTISRVMWFVLFTFCLVLSSAIGQPTSAPADATATVVAGNTALAMDLYAQLKGQPGNLFFSPYSISTALAMADAGARGQTEQQMAQALHFTLGPEQLHPAFATLAADLNAIQQKGQVQLSIANSLWPQNGYQIHPEYLEVVKKDYGTTITSMNYKADAEAARKTINDWVEGKTNHKITDLLKHGVVSDLTRLVLVDAIYFKGNWAAQFDPQATTNQPFYVTPAKHVNVPLMQHTGQFRYAETPELQMLELPYAGNDLSMIVLLPRKLDGIGALEDKLTPANLADWTKQLAEMKETVVAYLPKFKATGEFKLKDTLLALGMTDAFNEQADFSGIGGRKGELYISNVIHKAFVDVNEEGTEAAAATAVVFMAMGGMPHPQPVFRADHPFVFLIRDNQTGSVLFLGRLTDPAS